MEEKPKIKNLSDLKRFALTVRQQNTRLYNKAMNSIEVPDEIIDHVKTLYINLQLKMIDVMNAAKLLENYLKMHIRSEQKTDENE